MICIRALKVFLVFRGAWAAVLRRLRGWFGGCRCGSVIRRRRAGPTWATLPRTTVWVDTTVQSDGSGGVDDGGCGGGGGAVAGACSALDGGARGVPFPYDAALPCI